jgi:hypothetical protein
MFRRYRGFPLQARPLAWIAGTNAPCPRVTTSDNSSFPPQLAPIWGSLGITNPLDVSRAIWYQIPSCHDHATEFA